MSQRTTDLAEEKALTLAAFEHVLGRTVIEVPTPDQQIAIDKAAEAMGIYDVILREVALGNAKLVEPQQGSQIGFLCTNVFEVLYEGTRGPGKTWALLMDFAKDCGKGFGAAWRGVLFRQTYPQLQDVVAKSKAIFYDMFPGIRFNEAKYVWTWPGGEQLFLRQFDADDDYWNYHGHEYPWQGWEELCNWPRLSGYKRMQSCCRSTDPRVAAVARIRATTNPFGPGHNVVKARFKLPAMRGRILSDCYDEDGNREPPRMAIYGHLQENKILLTADPQYVSRIIAAARSKSELRAWLHGDWDIVAGGMFDDVWDRKYHVVTAFDIPDNWRIDRSFDWGSSKPFSVGWWAVSDGSDVKLRDGRWRATVRGDLFRINEWYGSRKLGENEGTKMLATEIAQGIVEREIEWKLHGRVRPGPADSAIFSAENGMCIATDMAKSVWVNGKKYKGVEWTSADKRPGSRVTGWEAVRKVLKHAKPVKGAPREFPGLFFFHHCVNAINQLPVLPRDEKKPDDVDTKAEDHIGDEVRYRVRNMNQGVTSGRTQGGH